MDTSLEVDRARQSEAEAERARLSVALERVREAAHRIDERIQQVPEST
jgi:hypothetical protein